MNTVTTQQIPEVRPEPDIKSREQEPLTPALPIPQPVTGNCSTINALPGIDSYLWEIGLNNEAYVTVACKEENKKEDSKIPSNWGGLFSEKLFSTVKSYLEKEKFEIHTDISSLASDNSENFQVTFSGNKFNTSITGEWRGETKETDGKVFKIISVISPDPEDEETKKIFLFPN